MSDIKLPIQPIRLTRFGDTLQSFLTSNDDERLTVLIGIHETCGGRVKLHPISETHNAIVCCRCFLRISIPVSITTYKELRRYIEDPAKPNL